jgi:hypothetical protein
MAEVSPVVKKSKPTRATSALLTGGGAGAGLAAFAQTLSEPYKTWISIAAPAASAVIAAFWPLLLNWSSERFSTLIAERTKKRAIKAMDDYIIVQQRRLEDKGLDDGAKQLIKQRIAEVQRASADQEHSTVSIYLQAAGGGW